jgi:hypothetical protein
MSRTDLTCPACGDPIPFAFNDAGGVGAYKRGEGFNNTPDTAHYVCFPCGKCWKQRLDGCGTAMLVTRESATPVEVELTCMQSHRYAVRPADDGGLQLEDAPR